MRGNGAGGLRGPDACEPPRLDFQLHKESDTVPEDARRLAPGSGADIVERRDDEAGYRGRYHRRPRRSPVLIRDNREPSSYIYTRVY